MGIEVQGDAEHKWQYLDREKIKDLGLEWYDLKARGYESVLGRFHSVDSDLTNQESYSTYQYGWNNPILRSDPDGLNPCCEGVVDFMTGVGQAFTENIAGSSPINVNPGSPTAYNNGRATGHILSAVVGAGETALGLIGLAGSAIGEVGSLGTATPVVAATATGSVSLITHGAYTGSNALENLKNDKGKVDSHGNHKTSNNIQHGYEIRNKKTKELQEYGISGQPLNKNGTSPRIAQKINTKYGGNKDIVGRVVKMFKPRTNGQTARERALDWETGKVEAYKNSNPSGNKPPRQIRP